MGISIAACKSNSETAKARVCIIQLENCVQHCCVSEILKVEVLNVVPYVLDLYM